jgi:kanamycin kinase
MGDVPSTSLPKDLSKILRGYSYSIHPYDESQAEIYILTHPSKDTLYLKIRRNREQNHLETEYKILIWIKQRIPTPKPIYYRREDRAEYMVTSEVSGTPAYLVQPEIKGTAVRILGETLRSIHRLETSGCPVVNSIEKWLQRLKADGKDTTILEKWWPEEQLVFTHGDYCLPNMIIKNSSLSGVLDWDYAGLADPYVDFAACTRSIRYNYGVKESNENWIPLFYEAYGLDEVDERKIDYFINLLDLI